MLSPVAPCFPEPPPEPPRFASIQVRRWRLDRSRRSASATADTSPPGPPSPPSGPPFGTCFSRRKLSAPSPPRPATTRMRARSLNIVHSVAAMPPLTDDAIESLRRHEVPITQRVAYLDFATFGP